jgi:galactose-1-phosphate uridylyltransferase
MEVVLVAEPVLSIVFGMWDENCYNLRRRFDVLRVTRHQNHQLKAELCSVAYICLFSNLMQSLGSTLSHPG